MVSPSPSQNERTPVLTIFGVRAEEEAKQSEAPETSEDLFGMEASQVPPSFGKSKRQEISIEYNKSREIALVSGKLQKSTENQGRSRRSRKRRLSEFEEASRCFDLEVEFMDQPDGHHLVSGLTIYISDSFSLHGVLATLLVLHSNHFAASKIDPENFWLVELFLPAKDTEAAPGEQVLVEEIYMEDNITENGMIWERLSKECMLNREEVALELRLSDAAKSKRAKMRPEGGTRTQDAQMLEKKTEEASKVAGPKICLHLNV